MKIKLTSKRNALEKETYELKFANDNLNVYSIYAYSGKKEVGIVTFKLETKPYRRVVLHTLKVDEIYRRKGYGTALLKAMEYVAFRNRFDDIEGRFLPEYEKSKAFYEKEGFTIYKDVDGGQVFTKTIDYDEIKNKIIPAVTEYDEEFTSKSLGNYYK